MDSNHIGTQFTDPHPVPTSDSRLRTTTCSFSTVLPGKRSGRTPRRPALFRPTTVAYETAGVWTRALLDRRPGHPFRHPTKTWWRWPSRRTSRSSGTAAPCRCRHRRARVETTPRTTNGRPSAYRRTVPCGRRRPAWRTPVWSRRTTPTAPAWALPGCSASSSRPPSAFETVWTSNANGPWPPRCWP